MAERIFVSVTSSEMEFGGMVNQSKVSPAASEIHKIAATATAHERDNQRHHRASNDDEKTLSLEELVEEVDQLLKQPEMSAASLKKQPVFQSVLE